MSRKLRSLGRKATSDCVNIVKMTMRPFAKSLTMQIGSARAGWVDELTSLNDVNFIESLIAEFRAAAQRALKNRRTARSFSAAGLS